MKIPNAIQKGFRKKPTYSCIELKKKKGKVRALKTKQNKKTFY